MWASNSKLKVFSLEISNQILTLTSSKTRRNLMMVSFFFMKIFIISNTLEILCRRLFECEKIVINEWGKFFHWKCSNVTHFCEGKAFISGSFRSNTFFLSLSFDVECDKWGDANVFIFPRKKKSTRNFQVSSNLLLISPAQKVATSWPKTWRQDTSKVSNLNCL